MNFKFLSLTFFTLFLCTNSWGQDKMTEVLKKELQYSMSALSKQDLPPYYMNFRMVDNSVLSVEASFGALTRETDYATRIFVPHLRLGSSFFDNYFYTSQTPDMKVPSQVSLTEINEDNIATTIWNSVEQNYFAAKSIYMQSKAKFDIDTKQDDKAPNFVETNKENYYEEPLSGEKYTFDKKKWEEKLRSYSALFKKDKLITIGNAQIIFIKNRKYFVDSDGSSVVRNESYVTLMLSSETKADDGMQLPLYISYFAFTPDGLPDDAKIIADIELMIKKMALLRKAPVVSPYAGPALMAGNAAGVFFHEIFGHRIEGQRMKTDKDGQTFKSMVGKQILPKNLNVYDDPSLKTYNGKDLYGFYTHDEQGVKGRRVDVIANGVLNEFLMSRTGINGFEKSNGHGRAANGFQPTARQSNLIIETSDAKSEKELRELLIAEIKKQGKEFGYYFKQVSAGLAFTGIDQVNAFNVTPLEVYRVFTDGREDQLVRGVDMIGTPLSIFENIVHAGGETEIFIGNCGAESGSIPVTAISPTVMLSKVEVQRKPKSEKQLPILSKPE